MSRDSSPSRDTDFEMLKCVQCRERFIGKSMWPCGECEEMICQSCDTVKQGCAYGSYNTVCKSCFDHVFKGKRK
jgi:hypothetical protein